MIEQDAPDQFDPAIPPGGFVCSTCGTPVESEPCRDHQPAAWANAQGTGGARERQAAARVKPSGVRDPMLPREVQ